MNSQNKIEGFEVLENSKSNRIIDLYLKDEFIEKLVFPFKRFDITALEYKPFARFTLAKNLDDLTKDKKIIDIKKRKKTFRKRKFYKKTK